MAARPQPKGDCGAPGEKKMRPTDAVLQYVVVVVGQSPDPAVCYRAHRKRIGRHD
jgi:hypothetical protein